ncbi:MAG: DUF2207 domain-containing protein [Saprospiraceae bacterium]|nr:DUF2207 domain-containing protein [Saprospiraceae bacterium]
MLKSLFIIVSLLMGLHLGAQGFEIRSFDVKIKIDKDGFIDVEEHIRVEFTEKKRGIIRNIPFKYSYQGKSYKTKIDRVIVESWDFKVSDQNNQKSIRIGHPEKYLEGNQDYLINYRVKGPFIHAGDYDEFYWNITGNEWTASIEQVKFDIELPDDTPLAYQDLKVFTGRTGSKQDSAYIEQSGRHISGTSIAGFNPGEGLTVALRLPSGYINPENAFDLQITSMQKTVRELKTQWPLALVPAILFSLLVGFWNKLRGISYPKVIEPQPYPPQDLNPAEVGAFYDQVVHDRDVISLLPYWAADGFIRMEYNPQNKDTYLIKLKDLDQDRPAYEYVLFQDLFNHRYTVSLSNLRYQFSGTHQKVKSMIRNEIIGMQLYDEKYRYWFNSWRIWIILVGLIPMAVFSFILGYWLAGVLFLIGLIVMIVLANQSKVLSEKGKFFHHQLKGFYAFLNNERGEQYKNIMESDPLYFDKVYPYAVALKLDKSFVKQVKPYQQFAPVWYGYYGMMAMGQRSTMEDFDQDFQPKEITSAFSVTHDPATASSGGGGGFSGGGSSGGGFGGGGGSSW